MADGMMLEVRLRPAKLLRTVAPTARKRMPMIKFRTAVLKLRIIFSIMFSLFSMVVAGMFIP
jgi:hypothetical protein